MFLIFFCESLLLLVLLHLCCTDLRLAGCVVLCPLTEQWGVSRFSWLEAFLYVITAAFAIARGLGDLCSAAPQRCDQCLCYHHWFLLFKLDY